MDLHRKLLTVSSGFTPARIAGLAAWYDFSDATSLSQTNLSWVPVTADGQDIGWALNKASPGTYDLKQSNGVLRPDYKTAAQNGRSVARFIPATDDKLDTTETTVIPAGSVFIALKWSALTTDSVPDDAATGGANREVLYKRGPGGDFLAMYGGIVVNSTTTVGTEWHVLSGEFAGANSNMWSDTIQIITNQNAGATAGNAGIRLGTDIAGGQEFAGDIGEYVIYNRVLTATERKQVEDYLMGRWYSPASLANLTNWYDFSNAGTLFTDTARTTPVSADGQEIRGITDLSTSAIHLTSSLGSGLVYRTGGQNNRSIGDGITVGNKFAQGTGAPITADATGLAVVKGVVGDAQAFLQRNSVDGDSIKFQFGPTGNNLMTTDWRRDDGTGLVRVQFASTTNTWYIVAARTSGTTMDIWGNNTSSTNSHGADAPGVTTDTCYVGGYGGSSQQGSYGEVFAYNRALTNAEINRAARYLAGKWNLTWTNI